jgi:hypothetical protein
VHGIGQRPQRAERGHGEERPNRADAHGGADRCHRHPGRASIRVGRVAFVFDPPQKIVRDAEHEAEDHVHGNAGRRIAAPPRVFVKLPQVRLDLVAASIAIRRIHVQRVQPRPPAHETDRAERQRAHAGASAGARLGGVVARPGDVFQPAASPSAVSV